MEKPSPIMARNLARMETEEGIIIYGRFSKVSHPRRVSTHHQQRRGTKPYLKNFAKTHIMVGLLKATWEFMGKVLAKRRTDSRYPKKPGLGDKKGSMWKVSGLEF